MKIDSSNRTSPLSDSAAPVARGGNKPRAGAAGTPRDNVQISSTSAQLQALETSVGEASGFDSAKVEAIKQAISEGRFTINAEAIADKLIASTRELLAKQG